MSEEKSEPLTRTYTIPLNKAMITPRHRRAKRAVAEIKKFATKHMKSEEIKIEPELNELLWNRGIRNPPRRITVKMDKDEDGVITISLATTAETATEAEVEAETKAEPKAKAKKKPKAEAKSQAEAETEAEAKTEAKAEVKPEEQEKEEEKK